MLGLIFFDFFVLIINDLCLFLVFFKFFLKKLALKGFGHNFDLINKKSP